MARDSKAGYGRTGDEKPDPNLPSADNPGVGEGGPGENAPGNPENAPEDGDPNALVFFETTVAKVVKDKDGVDVVVMSDHVGPGERLQREVEAEKADAEAKAEADRNKRADTQGERSEDSTAVQGAAQQGKTDVYDAKAKAQSDKSARDNR